MAKSNRALTGCGIGCGAILLLLSLVATVGYFLIRGSVHAFKNAEHSQAALDARFGEVEDFVPPADGTLNPARLEAFLTVRHALAPVAEECALELRRLEGRIDRFEEGEEKATFWEIVGTVGKGLGTLPQMADFVRLRNETLLDQDMSLGEYVYLYVTIYYVWLEKPPSDGPRFNLQGNQWGESWSVQLDEPKADGEDVYAIRARELRRQARRLTRPMLESMLQAVEDAPAGRYSPAWKRRLSAEVQAIDEDRDRLPWADGLPASWIPVLESRRAELDTLYWPMTNPLEMMRKND